MSKPDAVQAGIDATGTTGECQVCGRTIALRLDGMPKATHNRTIVHREADEHGPAETVTVECKGSRRPPVEYVTAFDAARKG